MNIYVSQRISVSKNTEQNPEKFEQTFQQLKNTAEKYVSNHYRLKTYNEDLISNLITSIWAAHAKFNKNKGKSYNNYILDHCKWTVLEYSKNKKLNNSTHETAEKEYEHSRFKEIDAHDTISNILKRTVLTSKESEVIKLKYYEGLSSQEIATRMKATKSYVNKLLKDALLEMRLSANRIGIDSI